MLELNPFISGRSLHPEEFIGRSSDVIRIMSAICTSQPIAIVGQPHIGKTSLLHYICSPEVQKATVGDLVARHIFTYLNAHTLRDVQSHLDFWKRAIDFLIPAIRKIDNFNTEEILESCHKVKQQKYDYIFLEQLIYTFIANRFTWVLVIDEFDDILANPVLNTPTFFGQLRTLTSQIGRGMTLVTSSRLTIAQMNQLTSQLNPYSSPYFNTLKSLHLGALPQSDFDKLIQRAGTRFTPTDSEYVQKVSGRHPYIAQAAATFLWEADQAGLQGTPRYSFAMNKLHSEIHKHYDATWTVWNNRIRIAMTAIALAQTPEIVGEHRFDIQSIVRDIGSYKGELYQIINSGLISEDRGVWNITQDAFFWYLEDILRAIIYDESAFDDWVTANHMDSYFSKSHREQFVNTAKNAISILEKAGTVLLESMAKGFGEGYGKNIASGGTP